MRHRCLLLVAAAGLVGCGHGKLVPARSATIVKGSDSAAFVVIEGLRCSADSEAWEGRPGDLPGFVAPVKVRIRNQTGAPVLLRYEDFALVGKGGRRYLPLPLLPLDPGDRGAGLTIHPVYSASRFFIAPSFSGSYPTLAPWTASLPRDEGQYGRAYAKWGDHTLPRSVLRAGLPEGVLENGGMVTGFLYFESPVRREDRVTFQAQLAGDEAADAGVTNIEIPFRVD
ncbi:MAG TPA: hypothetical protein VGP07_20375 [Polyangia bacterium]